MKREISIAEKSLLTLEEAAGYFNIGINKLRDLTNDDHCPFVIWNGSKRLIKRKLFENTFTTRTQFKEKYKLKDC